MITLDENTVLRDCLSTDIIIKDGKTVTKDENVNAQLKNGDKLYCMNTGDVYMWDSTGKTLFKQ